MMNASLRALLLAGVCLPGVWLWNAPVLAQTGAGAAQDDVAVESDADDNEMEVMVVTVERRAQRLQDLAGTASAISGDQLKSLGVQSIEDLDQSIPGLSIANNQGNIEVFIRGIGSSNNTELGDPAAATHLNDVYVPRPSGFGAVFFDIERVEVNIGPQGTLRGRNATAGSVNIIPWAPGLGVWDFAIEASVGNFDEYRVEAVANIPIGDISALRLAGFVLEHDSYLTSVTPDSAALGLTIPTSQAEGVGVAEAADDVGVRIGYRIEPRDDLRATFTYDYVKQAGTGYTGVNFANPLGNGVRPEDVPDPREVFGRGFTPIEDTEHWGIKGHFEYETKWFDVDIISSYRDLVYDYEFVTPAGPNYPGALETFEPFASTFDDFSRIRFITDSESFVNEVRLSKETEKLFWTAGFFYFREDQRTFLGTTGDRNPFFQGVEFNQTTDTRSYSFYGDATYSVTDRLRVTGGIRYTDDQKERFGVNARYAFGIGGPDFSCCFINGVAHGTEGFEFAGLGRTLLIPDQNGDGLVDPEESIAFFFNGIANFGARDGFDDVFPGGRQIQDVLPDPVTREQCEGNFAFVGSCANFVPEFDGVVDFSLAPFNSSFAPQSGRLDNSFVDWRARAEYDVTQDNLLYFLVATGNKSGGFNDNIAGTEGLGVSNPAQNAPVAFDTGTLAPTYDPERVTLYELGSKNEFDVGEVGVIFNASAFYYDYTDLQLTTLVSTAQILQFEGVQPDEVPDALAGNVVAFTFNAANAEIYGAQFEIGLRLPDNWNIDTTLLYLQTEIVDSIEIQDSRFQADVAPDEAVNQSIEGNELPRTPAVQFNGALSKVWELPWGVADMIWSFGYRSRQHLTIFNGIDYQQPDNPRLRLADEVEGYWTVDAGAGLSFGAENQYRFEAYVNNLTNQAREQGIIITQFDNTRFFNRPRTYGARIRARF